MSIIYLRYVFCDLDRQKFGSQAGSVRNYKSLIIFCLINIQNVGVSFSSQCNVFGLRLS